MATMFLGTTTLTSQTSASGCGVLSEADASEAPALDVASELSIRARPAPLGITELSSLRIAVGLADLNLGAWLDGRGGDGWTEFQLGVRTRWTIDSLISVGIAPHLLSQWFRGFPSRHTMQWDIHAMAWYGWLVIGIALRDIPIVTPLTRPFLHISALLRYRASTVAIDVGMNSATELWIGLTAELGLGDQIRAMGALRTQPASARIASRIDLDLRQAIVCSLAYQRDLGITPELTWSWSFGG